MNSLLKTITLLCVLAVPASVLADDDETLLLKCTPGEGDVFHVALHKKDKAKLILSTGAVDGWMTTSENFYQMEFPGGNDRRTTIVTINRLSGLFTFESGAPPFGTGSESNTIQTGKCQQTTRDHTI